VLFQSTFTTTGVFDCRSSIPCGGEGTNAVTFGSGANTATVTFTGVHTTIDVTNHALPVTLGQFSVTATDGFTFPTHPDNPEAQPVLRFNLRLAQSTPVFAGGHREWQFGPGGGETLPLMMGYSYIIRPSGDPNYSRIVYTVSPFPFTLSPNATTSVTARVGATPEPASLILLGTGAIGTLLGRRRNRN